MLKKEVTFARGKPTSEGTPTPGVTLGAEEMLSTAGPEQQQKSQ
jgi:hypothetical protein